MSIDTGINCFIIGIMKLKSFFAGLFLMALMAPVFAGENSYISIVSPDDEEVRYEYNTEDLRNTRYTFIGSVSTDCVSVRALWTGGVADNLIEYLINGSRPIKGVAIDDFTLKQYKAGETRFEYNVSESLDNLKFGSNHYMFIAKFKDGRYKIARLTLYVHQGGFGERAKPVIYLYPKKKQNVKVSVAPEGGVTESIPTMGKGWNVTAYPDGRIYDKKTKTEYPYLFWESKDYGGETDMSEGFVVEADADALAKFFNEKLTVLGLNEKEIDDFCEYWIAEMLSSEKPYFFVTFYSKERIDRESPLTVSPKPDSVIRVYFDHVPLDEPIEVKEQELVPAERSGFAVVEWGGRRNK